MIKQRTYKQKKPTNNILLKNKTERIRKSIHEVCIVQQDKSSHIFLRKTGGGEIRKQKHLFSRIKKELRTVKYICTVNN